MEQFDQMRVAVALCALKLKPRDQSCSCLPYLLDLHKTFSTSISAEEKHHGEWRKRALYLEKSLSDLQAKHDTEQLERLASQARVLPPVPLTTPVKPPKKKAKKRHQAQSDRDSTCQVDFDTAVERKSQPDDSLQSVLERIEAHSRSSFSAFSALQLLLDVEEQHLVPLPVRVGTSKRALEAVGRLLDLVICPGPSRHASNEIVQTLSIMCPHILSKVIPPLLLNVKGKRKVSLRATSADDDLQEVLGAFIRSVGEPIIRAFLPMSNAIAQGASSTVARHAKQNSKSTQPPVPITLDCRKDLLGLLWKGVTALDELSHLAGGALTFAKDVREHLAMEAITELEATLSPAPRTGGGGEYVDVNNQGRTGVLGERVKDLGTKDAVAFLSRCVQVLLNGSTRYMTTFEATFEFVENRLLRERALAVMSRLLHGCSEPGGTSTFREAGSDASNLQGDISERGSRVDIADQRRTLDRSGCKHDPVTHSMILSVAETCWLYWLGNDG